MQRAPLFFKSRMTPRTRHENPWRDHSSAVYCTIKVALGEAAILLLSSRNALRQPSSNHLTRKSSKGIPCRFSASPRYSQYSKTASVGSSGRPSRATQRSVMESEPGNILGKIQETRQELPFVLGQLSMSLASEWSATGSAAVSVLCPKAPQMIL